MTVEVYPGPGNSQWQSTRYTASVDGQSAYVYGYTRVARFQTIAWAQAQQVEMSWLNYGADQTTTVTISKVSGSITSAIVYPEGLATSSIVGGVLTLSVPPNTRLHVEVNGDRANPILVFGSPIRSQPGVTTSWTSVTRLAIESINTGSGIITTSLPHGFADNDAIKFESSGAYPTLASGQLTVHDVLYVSLVSSSQFRLRRNPGAGTETITSAGSGNTVVPAQWSSGNTLSFPAGVHYIGRLFKVKPNASIYVGPGAVVVGSFDLRGTDGASIRGPGVVAGTFAQPEVVFVINSFSEQIKYCMTLGFDGQKYTFNNSVSEVTFAALPFYLSYMGVTSWTNVQVINPWYWGSGGLDFSPKTGSVQTASATDCYVFSSDDALLLGEAESNINVTIRGVFSIAASNSCFHLGYWPQPNNGKTCLIENCHALHVGIPDTNADITFPVRGGNTIFKSWSDGAPSETTYGRFLVTIRNLKVWGPMASRLFHLGNRQYPFDESNQSQTRQQYGNTANWILDGITTQYVPSQLSIIEGKDYANCPHDLDFRNIQIGATRVNVANFGSYVTASIFYNITIDYDTLAVAPGALIGKWVNMTGRRVTNPSEVVDFIVDAYANPNPASEAGMYGVVFTITASNNQTTVVTATNRAYYFPYYSPYTVSQMDNVFPGVMAQVYAYGASIVVGNLPSGPIRVTATAVAQNGAQYPVPGTITVFNDTSVNSRPSSKQIYVNPVSGSDSNPGTIGSKMRTIQAAILAARKNPSNAANLMSDADCGGAQIILDDGVYSGFGNTNYSNATAPWHTSDDWWLQIVSPNGGAIIRKVYAPNKYDSVFPNSFLFAPGWRPATGGLFTGKCRVQFSNCVFEDAGNAVSIGNEGTPNAIEFHCWIDGGESYSTAGRTTNHSVLYSNGSSGQIIGVNYNHGDLYCSGHNRHHHAEGWYGWTKIVDCRLEKYTGIALQTTPNKNLYVLNTFVDDQQAYKNVPGTPTDGYVWVADGGKLTVSIPGPGLMRVDSTAPLTTAGFNGVTTSFGPELQFIQQANAASGNQIIGVGFRNFPAPSNNGVFTIVSAGTNPNGTHFVVCSNPAAVAQQGTTTASLNTTTQLFVGRVYPAPLQYNEVIHPDIVQWNSDMSDTLFNTLTVRNVRETQGFYSGAHALTNCWLVNVSDGGKAPVNNFSSLQGPSGSLVNCGFVLCSFTGVVDFTGSQVFTNTCFVDTVFTRTSQAPAHGTTAFDTYYLNCHWEEQPPIFGADTARGVAPSTGPWYLGRPGDAPYLFTPDPSNLDTGSAYIPAPAEYIWDGAVAPTRGVWPNVGTYDFMAVEPAGSGTPATANAAVQNLSITQNPGSFGRGVVAAVLGLTFTIIPATAQVSNQVNADASVIPISITQLAASAVVPASVTYSAPISLSISQRPALASIPESVTNAVLNASLAVQGATAVVPRQVTAATQSLNIELRAASASAFSPPTLAAQSLSASILAASAVVNRLVTNTPISLGLSTPSQPQPTLATYAQPNTLALVQLPASFKIAALASVAAPALTIAVQAARFGRGVLAASQSATVSAQTTAAVTEVRAPVSAQSLSLAPSDIYQSNPATVTAVAVNMGFIMLTQSVRVPTQPFAFPNFVQLSQAPATAAIGAIATHSAIQLRIQQYPAEFTGTANILAGVISLSISPLSQGATSGTMVSHQTLGLYLQQPVAQVGTEALAIHIPNNLRLSPLPQTVAYPAQVLASYLQLSFSIPVQQGDASVFADVDAITLQLTPGDPEAIGLLQRLTTAEIIDNKIKATITQEIPSNPQPKEEWRIIQTTI